MHTGANGTLFALSYTSDDVQTSNVTGIRFDIATGKQTNMGMFHAPGHPLTYGTLDFCNRRMTFIMFPPQTWDPYQYNHLGMCFRVHRSDDNPIQSDPIQSNPIQSNPIQPTIVCSLPVSYNYGDETISYGPTMQTSTYQNEYASLVYDNSCVQRVQ
jgi:hypothetical protein